MNSRGVSTGSPIQQKTQMLMLAHSHCQFHERNFKLELRRWWVPELYAHTMPTVVKVAS